MSGFWGSLKGLVVEEVPSAAKPAEEAPVAEAKPRNTPVPAEPIMVPASVDEAVRAKLEEAVTRGAPEGFVELHDMYETLADSIPDEASRFKAAIKLVLKRGHDVNGLLGDIDSCIGVLESKKTEFEQVSKSQMTKTCDLRQVNAQNLDTDIKAKQELISKYQTEIAEMTQRRQEELTTASMERQKILTVQAGFTAAYDSVRKGLVDLRNKVSAQGKVG